MQYAGNSNNTHILPQRRIAGIPLANPPAGCSVGNVNCANWQVYQPFVLHTADDINYGSLPLGSNNNYQPTHAIAFRSVDITDPNNNSAPFANQTSYGGGKLGIYSFWNTCGAVGAPIKGIDSNSSTANQYEFYNYSPSVGNANPQEVGNQFFDNTGANTSQANLYVADFFNTGSPKGINIQDELYNLNNSGTPGNATLQVQAAIQVAFTNYLLYLECSGSATGNNGRPTNCSGVFCPPNYSS